MKKQQKIFSYLEGPQNGPAVVFVHGNPQSKETFLPIFETSLRDSYHLLLVDLPGHGDWSQREEQSDYSLGALAQFLSEFISHCGLHEVILCGQSLGGHICIRTAQQDLRVNGLITVGTPPLRSLDSLASAFKFNEVGNLFFQEQISKESALAMASLCYPIKNQTQLLISQTILQTNPKFRSGIFHGLMNGDMVDEIEILENFKGNVLQLCGENDQLVNAHYLKDLQNFFPHHIQTKILLGQGHFPQFEKPDALVEFISDFLTHNFDHLRKTKDQVAELEG